MRPHARDKSLTRPLTRPHTYAKKSLPAHARTRTRGVIFSRVFFVKSPCARARAHDSRPPPRRRARAHATRGHAHAHARTRPARTHAREDFFHRFSTGFSTGYAQVTGLIFPHSFFEKLRARLAYTRKPKTEQVFAFPQGANRCSLFHRLSTGPPVSKSYPQVIHRAGFAITKTDSAHPTYH